MDGATAKKARHRRRSFSPGQGSSCDVESAIRQAARARLVSTGGVSQRRRSQSPLSRVFLSPVSAVGSAISAEDALQEAETEIRASPARFTTPLRTVTPHSRFVTPSPLAFGNLQPLPQESTEKDWTKAHWKMLDSCFTDERIALGEAKGLTGMAGVDDVDFDSIIERFFVDAGSADWDR